VRQVPPCHPAARRGTSASTGGDTGIITNAGGTTSGGSGGTAVAGGLAAGGIDAGTRIPTAGGGASSGGAGGGDAGGVARPPLDCGPIGQPIVDAGPPKNRVNYVILADGYTSTTVETTLQTHIANAMAARFDARWAAEYIRYKNFVNICLFKTVSQTDGIGNGPTIFSCTGDDQSRLAKCDTAAAQTALDANTPSGMTVDWHSIVLNDDHWWNTGSAWMLWSGGNANGPKAALHEGGHGFHQLADEYGNTCTGGSCGSNTMGTGPTGTEYAEVDSTGDPSTTGGKWDKWIGYTQQNGTGLQGTWSGSRYVDTGQYRPSANSMMNSLFGTSTNTSFNSVSREQILFTIWRYVVPIDSVDPPAGAVANPGVLSVAVIDPAVISVDWTVDGTTNKNAGTTFDTSGLGAGTHTVSAKAYDNATNDWVRNTDGTCPSSVTGRYCSRTAWNRSQQTVTWTVTK
jgi:hypothetical protein